MKNNFIVLMGSDGSGKSTIASKLNEVLGYEVHHFGPPKSYQDGKDQYFNFILNTNKSVVCDRFHEGEQVYAPIYRNYTADYFGELEYLLKLKFNPLLVLIRPPFDVIKQRLQERGEDFVKEVHWYHAYVKLNHIYQKSNLPKITIDTSVNSVDENVEKILKHITI